MMMFKSLVQKHKMMDPLQFSLYEDSKCLEDVELSLIVGLSCLHWKNDSYLPL